MSPVVQLDRVGRSFVTGTQTVHALRDVDLRIDRGEMVAILGQSGSGKSTLLNTLGCLDRPTTGAYHLDGHRVDALDDDARADLRNRRLGFVFQGFNLMARTTALENVMLPMLYDRTGRFADPEARARRALTMVGLGGRLDHHPGHLRLPLVRGRLQHRRRGDHRHRRALFHLPQHGHGLRHPLHHARHDQRRRRL